MDEIKNNIALIENSGFAAQTSATRTDEGEKTEDEVDYDMPEVQRCDGTCNKIVEVPSKQALPCGHFYCENCITAINKENHGEDACLSEFKKLKKEKNASSPTENACADGSLTKNSQTQQRVSDKGTPIDKPNKAKRIRKRGSRTSHEKVWYSFQYEKKPLAVCMSPSASFGDLLKRVAICLNVNLETHKILLNIQNSSSDTSGEDRQPETTPLGNLPDECTLKEIHLPRSRMIILKVVSKDKVAEDQQNDEKEDK